MLLTKGATRIDIWFFVAAFDDEMLAEECLLTDIERRCYRTRNGKFAVYSITQPNLGF